ncbi:MAG: hypothetical protein IH987_09435, partial [Planctomycetes bacterium]|nr:hypothetical protein [Planctomycetota bacterium]
ITVSGGTVPYAVTISDDGPIAGGGFEETDLAGDDSIFEFVYTAPSDDVGTNNFTVTVEDTDGSQVVLPISIDVLCTGIGMCTEKLTNAELMAIGVLDFENEITREVKDDDGMVVFDDDGNPVLEVVDPGTIGSKLFPPNLAPANILNRLDIDKDGEPDNTADTDGDGLPDNWELGGAEVNDRVVFYPAPSAIVPGTPPTPIFTRRAVATSAVSADTDGDGLSDFVEVFGLKFIDENGNGRLDPDEWADFNGDGMPSVGEYPLDNVQRDASGAALPNAFGLLHDFDGFMFTDPANPDTDGDGVNDGDDNDPLINPRSFGNTAPFFVRFNRSDDPDIDKDGIGNGMDMGNDLTSTDAPGVTEFQGIDNPANMRELLGLFRKDLLGEEIVSESVVEDLLGADWDGNGLWRTTDVQDWLIVIDPDGEGEGTRPPDQFFALDPDDLENTSFFYTSQKLDNLTEEEIAAGKVGLLDLVNSPTYRDYNGRGIGLGWQNLLRPPSTTEFVPDKKIWAILYAWRMPGFDIDGDGFVGVPNFSTTADFDSGPLPNVGSCAEVAAPIGLVQDAGSVFFSTLKVNPVIDSERIGCPSPQVNARPFDDRIRILEAREQIDPALDGVIEVPELQEFFRGCGGFGLGSLTLMLAGLGLVTLRRRK